MQQRACSSLLSGDEVLLHCGPPQLPQEIGQQARPFELRMPSHVGAAPTITATSIDANATARAVGVRGIVLWLRLSVCCARRELTIKNDFVTHSVHRHRGEARAQFTGERR